MSPFKLPAEALAAGMPPQTFLHNMGLTGGTAWIGLLRIAAAKPGDTVFVSAAAGAVGSAVVQIAKAREMTVIGAAGGEIGRAHDGTPVTNAQSVDSLVLRKK